MNLKTLVLGLVCLAGLGGVAHADCRSKHDLLYVKSFYTGDAGRNGMSPVAYVGKHDGKLKFGLVTGVGGPTTCHEISRDILDQYVGLLDEAVRLHEKGKEAGVKEVFVKQIGCLNNPAAPDDWAFSMTAKHNADFKGKNKACEMPVSFWWRNQSGGYFGQVVFGKIPSMEEIRYLRGDVPVPLLQRSGQFYLKAYEDGKGWRNIGYRKGETMPLIDHLRGFGKMADAMFALYGKGPKASDVFE